MVAVVVSPRALCTFAIVLVSAPNDSSRERKAVIWVSERPVVALVCGVVEEVVVVDTVVDAVVVASVDVANIGFQTGTLLMMGVHTAGVVVWWP